MDLSCVSCFSLAQSLWWVRQWRGQRKGFLTSCDTSWQNRRQTSFLSFLGLIDCCTLRARDKRCRGSVSVVLLRCGSGYTWQLWGSYSTLPCMVSLSAAEAEKAQVRTGLVALVYADCVWWTSVWEHKKQQHWPRDCFTSLGTERKLNRWRRRIYLSHFSSLPGLDLWLLLQTSLGKLNIPLSSTLSTFAEPLGLFLAKCSATWTCWFCFHGKQIFENLLQELEISYLQEAQCVKLLYVLYDALLSWKHFKLLE